MNKLILFISLLCSLQVTAQTINYSEHIAPIIYENCTSCHRSGEIGPMPFTSYQEVKDWAEMVAYVTEIKYMPPWKPDRSYSTFVGEKGLTNSEIQLIQDWVADGTPQGDPTQEPPLPDFPVGSQLGTPDLVLSMEEVFTIEGDNQDDYRVFVLPTNEPFDREIAAVEFRPGNSKVVHHALLAYDTDGQAVTKDAQTPEYGYEAFGDFGVDVEGVFTSYTPGIQTVRYPAGIGKTLPAGADVLIQLHYAPITTEETDLSTVNIFFKEETDPINREVDLSAASPYDLAGGIFSFFIQPDETKQFHGIVDNTFEDRSLISVYPHSHLLGQDWEIFAITPEEDTIPIIKIDEWDFNWQGDYTFDRMKKIPKDSKVHVLANYDNTLNNPFNPSNPPQLVTWGEQTTDEMFLVGFNSVTYQEGDEDIVVDDQATSLQEWTVEAQHHLYAPFPNPVQEDLRIVYYLAKPESIMIQLQDISGKLVRTLFEGRSSAGNHTLEVGVKHLSSGAYLLVMKGDDFMVSRKVVVVE